MRRRHVHPQIYYYLSIFTLLLVRAGTGLLLSQAAIVWSMLAVLASAAAWRFGRVALSLQAAAYGLAAAFASGLLAWATAIWVGSMDDLTPAAPAALVVLGALGICWWIPLKPAARTSGWYSCLPRLAIAAAFTWGPPAGFVAVASAAIAHGGGALGAVTSASAGSRRLRATALARA